MEPTTSTSPTSYSALASFEDKEHDVCESGNTFAKYSNSSPELCAQACLDEGNICVGFNYFYESFKCSLSSSTNTEGCSGNVDWYKRKMAGEDESLLELGDGSAFDEMYE
jgi:hypothetical protein